MYKLYALDAIFDNRKFMKNLLTILLVAVLVLTYKLYETSYQTKQQANQIIAIQNKINAFTKTADLDLQAKCSKQASFMFNELGYNKSGNFGSLSSYQSHYNNKFNKCFLSIYSVEGKFVNQSVIDAYEQKVFATYMWTGQDGKKYWEVAPVLCKSMPDTSSEKICKSDKEYKEFVKSFME